MAIQNHGLHHFGEHPQTESSPQQDFFDDIVSRATGADRIALTDGIADHGIILSQEIAAADLRHNVDKTVIVASVASLAQGVADKMRRAKVPLATARDTRDVGLDAGGAARESPKSKKEDS